MGTACVSSCSTSKKTKYRVQIPDDTQDYSPQVLSYNLPKLTLKGLIFDIKLMNFKRNYVSLKFQIQDVISIVLPQKQVINAKTQDKVQGQNQLKWKMHQEFAFSLTEYELRTHFLNIQIFGENRSKLTNLSVNLFLIVTGAHHHDFQICKENQTLGRLMFDFKISQIIDFKLDINSIGVQFGKDLSGQQLDYSFKIMTHNQVVYESEPHNPKIVNEDKFSQSYRQYKTQDECQSPMKIRKDSRSKKMIKMQKKSTIQWDQNKNSRDVKQIQAKLETSELNNSFLYIILWKINKENTNISQTQNTNKIEEGQIIGYALIKFNKILEFQYNQRQITLEDSENKGNSFQKKNDVHKKTCYKVEERMACLNQKIWFEGQIIASCKIDIKMVNPHYFKQLQACSRTEDGIVNMTFLFKTYGMLDLKVKNEEINKLIKSYQRIQELFQKKDKLQMKNYEQRRKSFDYQHQIQQNFENIAKNLQNTLNQSFAFGSKKHNKEMTEDQTILIGLLSKLYFYISDETVYSTICWKIVVSIMKRGELYLENIGFVQKTLEAQIFDAKVKIALQYQNIMFKYLILAIRHSYVNFQGGAFNKYIEAFKAQCYFKIPQYRDHILLSIQKKYDQDVIQFQLQNLETMTSQYSSLLKSRYEAYMMNLDWKKYFYQKIQHYESYKETLKSLIQQLQNSDWIKQLSKREQIFYQFTAEIMKRLNELSGTIRLSKWNYFPGYTKIIRGFLVEMKKKSVLQFSSEMIKTSTQLLAHEDLINILMPLVIQKVNGFDKNQLSLALSLLHMFLDSLTDKRTKSIPRTFNYVFFFKTIKSVLQLDNIEGISKMLIIIYDFYQWISYEWRDNFTMYLLGKVFFKFFFHWSHQVRLLFYNLLIIKIYFVRIKKFSQRIKLSDRDKNAVQMSNVIADRYDSILIILANAQTQKKSQSKDFSWFQKDLFKRMKRKKQREQSNNRKLSHNFGKTEASFKNKQKYSIQNLLKENHNSLSLNKSKLVDDIRSRSRTTCQFKPVTLQNNSNTQLQKEEVIQVIRGSSIFVDDQFIKSLTDLKKSSISKRQKQGQEDDQPSIEEQLNLSLSRRFTQSNKRANFKKPTILIPDNKKRTFDFFQAQDHELQDLKVLEATYILKGLEEYRDALQGIQKYINQKGQLPQRNIQMEQFDAKMAVNG